MIPDISRPRILIIGALEYARKPIASMMKVSVTADLASMRRCLNIKEVANPKKTPRAMDTIPKEKNYMKMVSGVIEVNELP